MSPTQAGSWWRRFAGQGRPTGSREADGAGVYGLESSRRISRIAREWTATFDTIPDYIALIDSDYRIMRVNRAMARLLEREPRDIIGRRCYELVHGTSAPWHGCPHQSALEGDCCVTQEVVDPHLGIPLLVTCSPFHEESGALIGTAHVARDISEQKRAQEAQRQLIAQLQGALSKVQLLSRSRPSLMCFAPGKDDRHEIPPILASHMPRARVLFSTDWRSSILRRKNSWMIVSRP